MAVAFTALVIAFVITVVLTPVIRTIAIRTDLLDQALSSRKLHERPIPRLGGIAIVLAFYTAVGGALMWPQVRHSLVANSAESPAKVALILLGGLGICFLGLYDDIKGAGAKEKFTVQLAISGVLYTAGLRIELLENPFGASIALGVLSLPVTVLWITGITNALNLIDGLDGLAGGVALAASAMVCAASAHAGHSFAMISGAAVAGATCAFLIYNFNPASIFMGDTGSMFLGYVIATSAIRPQQENTQQVALVAWVVALGIPIADTLTAIVRRAVRGAPLFSADREHIHHRLLELGLTQRQASLILWSVAALLAGAGMTLAGCGRGALLIALVFSGTLALNQLGCLRFRNLSVLWERRRENLARRRGVDVVGDQLRRARGLHEILATVQGAAPALGANYVRLLLQTVGSAGEHRLNEHTRMHLAPHTSHSILTDRDGIGTLHVSWPDARTSLDRDTEIAIELLCKHIAAAVRRIDRGAPRPTPWRPLRAPYVEAARPPLE